MRHSTLLIGMLALFLVACSPTVSPTSSSTVTHLPTETEVIATIHPSRGAATPTTGPTPSLPPAPTEETFPRIHSHEAYSPNGDLVARVLWDFPSEWIEITTLEGELVCEIPFQGEIPMGDPRRHMHLYGWSLDGSKLYFYYQFSHDGPQALWQGYDLQEIRIDSGLIQPVFVSKALMAFAFSPGEDRIAYVRHDDDPRIVFIRDLESGEVKTVPLSLSDRETREFDGLEVISSAGRIIWSPSGDKILVTTEVGEELELVLIDLESLKAKSLLKFWWGEYEVEEWLMDDRIRLVNWYEGRVEILDMNSGEIIIEATPTPDA